MYKKIWVKMKKGYHQGPMPVTSIGAHSIQGSKWDLIDADSLRKDSSGWTTVPYVLDESPGGESENKGCPDCGHYTGYNCRCEPEHYEER